MTGIVIAMSHIVHQRAPDAHPPMWNLKFTCSSNIKCARRVHAHIWYNRPHGLCKNPYYWRLRFHNPKTAPKQNREVVSCLETKGSCSELHTILSRNKAPTVWWKNSSIHCHCSAVLQANSSVNNAVNNRGCIWCQIRHRKKWEREQGSFHPAHNTGLWSEESGCH